MLVKEVASEFAGKVCVVTEEYGNSPMAEKWGVRRYPVVFVDDVLVARPKDFGFKGADDTGQGLYVPWREAKNQQRFKVDLRRMVEMRLKGERVTGLDVADVRTSSMTAADGPERLPAFPFKTVTGETVDPAALTGRVVVVEMWATWCPPCRSTMTWLNELKKKYGDGIEIVAIAVDSPPEDVKKMAAELKANYHIVQGAPETVSPFGEVAAVPKLFVFDRSGARAHTFYGAPPGLHKAIKSAVDDLAKK